MEVKIKNLFGYRNYDLKLNNKVNILIGENGSGKSTILKMLICIFNNDFVELSKIPFEEINVKLPVKKDNELYEVKDGKKNKIDSVEFNIKSSDLTQLEYTKDAKFRIIFKKFLEEYAFENDYINENFAFEKFLKELEKKVNSEKSGIIIEVKDDYIVDDAKYFLNLLINLDDLNIDRFLEIYPLESQLLLPFLLNDIVYGSRMYLFYFYMFYLLKNVEDKHKPSPETFIHLTGGYLTKFDSIFNYTYFYNDICQFPLNFIFNDINLTNGYYYFDNETIRMTLIETEITDKNLNQKLKILHNTFNKGLILTKLICEKADLDDYVIYTEDKKYDIDLMSKQSYIKLIKDICDINMLEGLGEEYISGNYIPSLCYLSIDEIEPNELAKYIEVMRIIKKFKEKYEFPKEEKTNEKEFYDFWNKTRCGSHIKGLGEKEFTREDYILELSDDPINSIVSKKKIF